MRHYWWIVRNNRGDVYVVHCYVVRRERISVAGPYWSREEADKVLVLWK